VDPRHALLGRQESTPPHRICPRRRHQTLLQLFHQKRWRIRCWETVGRRDLSDSTPVSASRFWTVALEHGAPGPRRFRSAYEGTVEHEIPKQHPLQAMGHRGVASDRPFARVRYQVSVVRGMTETIHPRIIGEVDQTQTPMLDRRAPTNTSIRSLTDGTGTRNPSAGTGNLLQGVRIVDDVQGVTAPREGTGKVFDEHGSSSPGDRVTLDHGS